MKTETTKPKAFILKAKSGKWSWELHIDGDLHQVQDMTTSLVIHHDGSQTSVYQEGRQKP